MTPQQWLQSKERDYDTGRQIYAALGRNSVLKRRLESGPNAYNRESLEWELRKLPDVDVVLAVPVEHLAQRQAELSPADLQKQVLNTPPPTENPLVQELKAQARPLYDRRAYLHAQLEHVEEAERLPYALEIQALSRQLNAHWETVAYVREHGQLPAPVVVAAFDVAAASLDELMERRANLRANLSKWKKKEDRAEDYARGLVERDQLTARIDELKKQRKEVGRG